MTVLREAYGLPDERLRRSLLEDPQEHRRIREGPRADAAEVIALKARRRVRVGDNLTFLFENRQTVLFQIQEMMRTERIVHDDKMQEEIDAYNALLPGQGELSATLFIEIPDLSSSAQAEVRETVNRFQGLDREMASRLRVGEHRLPARFEGGLSKEEKMAAVHYLRFPVTREARSALAIPPPGAHRGGPPELQGRGESFARAARRAPGRPGGLEKATFRLEARRILARSMLAGLVGLRPKNAAGPASPSSRSSASWARTRSSRRRGTRCSSPVFPRRACPGSTSPSRASRSCSRSAPGGAASVSPGAQPRHRPRLLLARHLRLLGPGRTWDSRLLYALYVWSGIEGNLALLEFWLVLTEKYNVGQAKRVFGVVGTGSLLGAVAGALAARLIVAEGSPSTLILVAAVVFAITGLGPALLLRRRPSGEGAPSDVRDLGLLLEADPRGRRTNPYVRGLEASCPVSTVALTLADYVFKSTVARQVPAADLATSLPP